MSLQTAFGSMQEEKQELLKELEVLQAKLKVLDGVKRRSLLQRQLETSMLRGAVHQQHLQLVNTQSAVSAYVVCVVCEFMELEVILRFSMSARAQ